MAFFTLPLDPTLAHYEFETDLGGVSYRLLLKYNARDDSWNCNFLDVAGNILRSGIKIVTDWSLLSRWVDQGRPDGRLFSVALGDIAVPASLGELGDAVKMVYDDGEG
jgi:hypothetical protein